MSLADRVQGDRGQARLTADGLREKASNARRVRRIGWPGIPLYVRLGRVTIDPGEAEYVASMIEWADNLERAALRLIAANRSLRALDEAAREMADVLGLKP